VKTYLDCIPCLFRQALSASRLAVKDPERQENILRMVMEQISRADFSKSPPHVAGDVYRLIKRESGCDDPFEDIKRESNRMAEDLYPKLKDMVERSPDRLETAVKLAIAGNVIDFGANHSVDRADVRRSIDESMHLSLPKNALGDFRSAVSRARSILYIGDNAGEIVFDRLLIEQMLPKKIVYAVRGSAVINDVTRIDAEETGLDNMVEVIDSGSDMPGTVIDQCSKEFVERYEQADFVIAKGQGNYETLNEEKKNILFMLKVKCPVVSADLDCSVGSAVIRWAQVG
jgi:uncharacterized protein with ATP-grasp and redox domains